MTVGVLFVHVIFKLFSKSRFEQFGLDGIVFDPIFTTELRLVNNVGIGRNISRGIKWFSIVHANLFLDF